MNAGRRLEHRIRVEPDGTVTALSGKIEFGQGIRTAFAQVVADELDFPLERVRVVLGDTAEVPWDLGTFGSHSVAEETPVLRRAAAFARRQLLERASRRLSVAVEGLDTKDGAVVADGGRRVAYHDLIEGQPLAGDIPDDIGLLPAERRRHIGRPRPRLEARDIVSGRATYVADVRLPGMLRGAIVRPPVRGARALRVADAAAKAMPGVVAIVRDGDLIGVVAEREDQALAAADAVEVDWETIPPEDRPTIDLPMRKDAEVEKALASAAISPSATYTLPPVSSAPIGPSAAVADVRDDGATVYANTHRPFRLREAVAERLGITPERVRFVPRMGSGTYGRSALNDAAEEAAVLSRHAGRPVLLQWTRAEEFAFSPSRPVAVLEVSGGLDADGRVVAWRYDEHTNVHTSAGFDPRTAPGSSGRNAIPPYRFAHVNVVLHIEPTPLRTANFRSLAAAENVFAIESFVDELALASRQEPLDFRLRHIDDARLRRVVEQAAERGGLTTPRGERRGRGLACAIYHGTYLAVVAEVEVAGSGAVRLSHVWCVVDPGAVVNPDGVRNQIEGGIQQAASWTLLEELRHRESRIMTTGWDTYPIATFRDAPESIEVLVAGDPSHEPTGVGEPGSVPVAAAIANAVHSACGARVRDLPLTPDRVRKAVSAHR